MVDLSESGILFACEHDIRPGTHLEFTVDSTEISKSPLKMTGVVARAVRLNNSGHVALEFTRVNPAHKRALKEFIGQKMTKDL